MIRRMVSTSVAVLILALAAPFTLQAQNIFVMGGAVFPTGFDESEFFNTGWLAAAGISFDVGENGLFAGFEGTYGRSSVDDAILVPGADASAKPWSAMGFFGYSIPTEGSVDPYLFAGAGLQGVKLSVSSGSLSESESESGFGYQFGAGITFGSETGSMRPFVEGRYQGSNDENVDLKFFGISLGASFSVGS